MSRVLPCPKCGNHMWDDQYICDSCNRIRSIDVGKLLEINKCQNEINSSNSIYILESKIDSLQEKLDIAISELKKCQNELQKYKSTKDSND